MKAAIITYEPPNGRLETCAEVPAWKPQVLRRDGSPPLRFVGVRIYYACVGVAVDAQCVGLWQRRKPGFYVSHSMPNKAGAGTTAASVENLDEAATYLERYCEELRGLEVVEYAHNPVSADGLLHLIYSELQAQKRIERFLNLSARVLAQWDHWAETDLAGV